PANSKTSRGGNGRPRRLRVLAAVMPPWTRWFVAVSERGGPATLACGCLGAPAHLIGGSRLLRWCSDTPCWPPCCIRRRSPTTRAAWRRAWGCVTTMPSCGCSAGRPTPPAAAVGGFVFATAGIVSFSELGAPSTGIGAFVALAVLLTLNLLDRPRWRTAAWLGLDLVAQVYYSTEILATFLLFGVLALAV